MFLNYLEDRWFFSWVVVVFCCLGRVGCGERFWFFSLFGWFFKDVVFGRLWLGFMGKRVGK